MNYRVVLRRMWGSNDLARFETAIGHAIVDDPEAAALWRAHVERVERDRPKQVHAEIALVQARRVAQVKTAIRSSTKTRKRPTDKLQRVCRWCDEKFVTTRAEDAHFCAFHRLPGELPEPTVEEALEGLVRGSVVA